MIISLLTDFGTEDYFVGAMKGVILSIEPEAQIVDVTHQIEPQNIAAAGFTLNNCYREFPAGTIFLCVVDPGVGSDRRAVVVETGDYYFVAPDNGLLSFVLAQEDDAYRAHQLENPQYFRHPVSRTFHGRDIFAPVAAWLARGVNPADFGPEVSDLVRFEIAQPEKPNPKLLIGRIIHIDRFGNLITNLTGGDLPNPFVLEVNGRQVSSHFAHYSEAASDEIFTIFGSAGYLEIVAFKNSAERVLSAAAGQKIIVKM
jgi:S-adenosylmethionine hydrolase